MSDFVTSMVRDVIQKLFGIAFTFLAVHGFNINKDTMSKVDNWAVLAIIAALLSTWTAIVRSLEERKGSSPFDVWCRAIGRIFMLGVGSTPVYPKPPAPLPVVVTIPDPELPQQ